MTFRMLARSTLFCILICGQAMRSRATDISGTVLTTAQGAHAITGAQVEAAGPVNEQMITDDGGGYRFRGLPEGDYTLVASAPGHLPATQNVYAAGGIVVQPYTWLVCITNGQGIAAATGTVVDSSGQPLSNITVSAEDYHLLAFTDARGEYRFDRLRVDDQAVGYSFTASAPGYRGDYEYVEVHSNETAAVPPLVLTPSPPSNQVFFAEDFETDLGNWHEVERPDRMFVSGDMAYGGSNSLKMVLRGGDDAAGAGWATRRMFPGREGRLIHEGSDTIYMRWYQRWSTNYLFKGHNMYALSGQDDPSTTDHTLYVDLALESEEPSPFGHPLVMVRSTADICGNDAYCSWWVDEVTIQRNQWYCFEILAGMNDPYDPMARLPCRSNGTIRFWVDGVEVLNVDNAVMRQGLITQHEPVHNTYSRVVIGIYYHGGVPSNVTEMCSWVDDLVVANHRVAGAPGLWADAVDVGGGWRWLQWFGYFNVSIDPWIYHAEHGWMYAAGMSTADIWFFTPDMGWLWTAEGVYPYLYRHDDQAWLWYLIGSVDPRWSYNFSSAAWESD
ncbi:carboxypeptidase-like regulatory domain-containing protein [Verrucomicrobiota bacterium]